MTRAPAPAASSVRSAPRKPMPMIATVWPGLISARREDVHGAAERLARKGLIGERRGQLHQIGDGSDIMAGIGVEDSAATRSPRPQSRRHRRPVPRSRPNPSGRDHRAQSGTASSPSDQGVRLEAQTPPSLRAGSAPLRAPASASAASRPRLLPVRMMDRLAKGVRPLIHAQNPFRQTMSFRAEPERSRHVPKKMKMLKKKLQPCFFSISERTCSGGTSS